MMRNYNRQKFDCLENTFKFGKPYKINLIKT